MQDSHVNMKSLLEVNPILASEWHPSKNGTLSPSEVSPNSRKRVWWIYPYDDPNTGKHFEFEWEEWMELSARQIAVLLWCTHNYVDNVLKRIHLQIKERIDPSKINQKKKIDYISLARL